MKTYAQAYANLRFEIVNHIKDLINDILDKHEVDDWSDLDNAPVFSVYTEQYLDDGLGNDKLTLVKVTLEYLHNSGECAGYEEFDVVMQPYSLCELTTDSLIEVYEKLCKYLS